MFDRLRAFISRSKKAEPSVPLAEHVVTEAAPLAEQSPPLAPEFSGAAAKVLNGVPLALESFPIFIHNMRRPAPEISELIDKAAGSCDSEDVHKLARTVFEYATCSIDLYMVDTAVTTRKNVLALMEYAAGAGHTGAMRDAAVLCITGECGPQDTAKAGEFLTALENASSDESERTWARERLNDLKNGDIPPPVRQNIIVGAESTSIFARPAQKTPL